MFFVKAFFFKLFKTFSNFSISSHIHFIQFRSMIIGLYLNSFCGLNLLKYSGYLKMREFTYHLAAHTWKLLKYDSESSTCFTNALWHFPGIYKLTSLGLEKQLFSDLKAGPNTLIRNLVPYLHAL